MKKKYLDVDDLKGDDRISMKELNDLGKPGKSEKKLKKNINKLGSKRLNVSKSKGGKSAYAKYLSSKDDDYNIANFTRRR